MPMPTPFGVDEQPLGLMLRETLPSGVMIPRG
jgi:hypothetical protein